jgi:hypothetical protein
MTRVSIELHQAFLQKWRSCRIELGNDSISTPIFWGKRRKIEIRRWAQPPILAACREANLRRLPQ